jgi:hypothetical protein
VSVAEGGIGSKLETPIVSKIFFKSLELSCSTLHMWTSVLLADTGGGRSGGGGGAHTRWAVKVVRHIPGEYSVLDVQAEGDETYRQLVR